METDDSPTIETLADSTSHSVEGDLSTLVILPTPVVAQPTEQSAQEGAQEQSLTQEPQEETTEPINTETAIDDDFDDFGDFGQFASTAVEMFPVVDEGKTRYAEFNSNVVNQDIKNGINVIWPVMQELESKHDDHGLFMDKTKITPSVTDKDWVKLYEILVNDTVFSESGGSRLAWRRSMIRQRFLESLNISEVCFVCAHNSLKRM